MFPGSSFKLFKVLGISIEINVSWLVIFGLVAFLLTGSYFPAVFPGESNAIYLVMGVSTTVLFFSSIVLHELSHSYVALRNGIQIRRITLFIFGGVSEMGGEPPGPSVELKMALAGPGMSFFLALVFGLLSFGIQSFGLSDLLSGPFIYLALINGILGVFNLLPGFPLDGGRVLRAIVWKKTDSLHRSTEIAAYSGEGLAAVFVALGLFLILRGYLLNGVWIILIGWFLGQAAISSLQQMKISEALTDTPVSAIMSREIKKVPADITIASLVQDYFLPSKVGRFFVEKDGKIIGLVTLEDVGKISHERWLEFNVESIIQSLEDQEKALSSSPAISAMNRLIGGAPQILVFDDDKLVGILTKTDIIRLLQIRNKLGI